MLKQLLQTTVRVSGKEEKTRHILCGQISSIRPKETRKTLFKEEKTKRILCGQILPFGQKKHAKLFNQLRSWDQRIF